MVNSFLWKELEVPLSQKLLDYLEYSSKYGSKIIINQNNSKQKQKKKPALKPS